jgi:hypothetical protein
MREVCSHQHDLSTDIHGHASSALQEIPRGPASVEWSITARARSASFRNRSRRLEVDERIALAVEKEEMADLIGNARRSDSYHD